LLDLMGHEAFTLMIEIRELPVTPTACTVLAANGQPMIQRMPDGALAAFGLRTDTQPLRNWKSKRRVALAVDRAGGRVAIGVTGAKAVAGEARPDLSGDVTAGGAGTAGYLCRVTGWADYRPPDQLDAMLA
jgi:hypothetical protein